VNVSEVLPLSGTVAAPKALVSDGGTTTVRFAVDVLPVPRFEFTVTLLVFAPAVVPVICTLTAHEVLAAMFPPDNETELEFAVAVAVPPQVFDRVGVDATTMPAGSVSVNATALTVLVFGFWIVNVRDVLPFNGTVDAPNALAIVGG
jgi:hypothetical protein